MKGVPYMILDLLLKFVKENVILELVVNIVKGLLAIENIKYLGFVYIGNLILDTMVIKGFTKIEKNTVYK